MLREWQKEMIRDVYDRLDQRGLRQVRRVLWSMAKKNGKALALDTKIPTPSGWTTMGEIKVGDRLFDEKGSVCRVTFATPVHLQRRCYEIEFADGAKVIADAEHQWGVWRRDSHGAFITTTTEKMLADYDLGLRGKNYAAPVAGAIDCPHAELPVPAYTLGAWLGDGATDDARLTLDDKDADIAIRIACRDDVPMRRSQYGGKTPTWSMTDGVRDRTKDCLRKRLRAIGVLGFKHIPLTYQRASINQRMALLQGLMDTDGYVSAAGQCILALTNETLARDAAQLIRGLGFKASFKTRPARLYGREVGTIYQVQFWAYQDRPAFHLARKRLRLKPQPATPTRTSRNYIVRITPVESVPVRCITVDAPSSLFLFGEQFTPTHNTAIIAALVLVHLAGPEAIPQAQIFSGANSKKQAALIYDMAAAMVRLDAGSPEPLGLGDMILPVASKFRLVCHYFGSFYQSLSKIADVEEGASPTVWIYDELGRTKNTSLYDSLSNATGAWEEPLGFIISVQARSPMLLMSQLVRFARRLLAGEEIDPSWSVRVFEVPEDVDPFDEKFWHLANPALGDFKSLESIRDAAKDAKRMPSRMSSFLNFQLNQQVDDRVETIHRKEDWVACGGEVDEEDLRGQRCVGGLDLSRRIDLSAMALLFPGERKRVVMRIWTPAASVAERALRDAVPYQTWIKEGKLIETPGNHINFDVVAKAIAEVRAKFDMRELAVDPWKMPELEEALQAEGVDYWVLDNKTGKARADTMQDEALLCLVPFIQGFITFSPAVDQMEIDVLDHVLAHGDNPVLNWAASNAVVMHDTSGNRKLAKHRAVARIDPYVALTMANGLASRPGEPEEKGSIYDDLARLAAETEAAQAAKQASG